MAIGLCKKAEQSLLGRLWARGEGFLALVKKQ